MPQLTSPNQYNKKWGNLEKLLTTNNNNNNNNTLAYSTNKGRKLFNTLPPELISKIVNELSLEDLYSLNKALKLKVRNKNDKIFLPGLQGYIKSNIKVKYNELVNKEIKIRENIIKKCIKQANIDFKDKLFNSSDIEQDYLDSIVNARVELIKNGINKRFMVMPPRPINYSGGLINYRYNHFNKNNKQNTNYDKWKLYLFNDIPYYVKRYDITPPQIQDYNNIVAHANGVRQRKSKRKSPKNMAKIYNLRTKKRIRW